MREGTIRGGAGYKTLLLVVYKTSLFIEGSKVAGYKTSLVFRRSQVTVYKTLLFSTPKFAKGLFPDLADFKTSLKFPQNHSVKGPFPGLFLPRNGCL